jgi:7-keto-8-aminopelargonate synthetase-like enzyme
MRKEERFEFNFTEENRLVDEIGFNPYYQKISSGAGLYVRIGNEDYLNLASNNYLALADDPEVISAMKKCLDKYGVSMCGTPVACGYSDIYETASRTVSEFLVLEDTLFYPSCYQANMSIFRSLARPEDVIFVDRYAHSSLVEGIRSPGCRIKPFMHNDADHLESLLKSSGAFEVKFVVTESVFSTEGTIAPFDELNELCKKYGAIPVVDDSHGIGTIGRSGRGILEEKNIKDYEGIYTASTGKAIGISGGFVSAPGTIINYIKYNSPGLIYSTAVPPVLLAGTVRALEIIGIKGALFSEKLTANKLKIHSALSSHGYDLASGDAPICSVKTGSNEITLKICKSLFEKGILATPFIYPSVSRDKGIIRMIPRIDLETSHLDHIISSFAGIRSENPELFIK